MAANGEFRFHILTYYRRTEAGGHRFASHKKAMLWPCLMGVC